MSVRSHWVIRPAKDACEKIQDGTHFSPKNQLQAGPYPYVTAKNVRPWGLDLSTLTYLEEEEHRPIYDRSDVRRGDVLLVKDGVNAGDAAINTIEGEISLLSSVCFLRPKETLRPQFLRYYLQSPQCQAALLGKLSGSAIRRVILRNIRELPVIIAPLVEQDVIVAELDKQLSRLDEVITTLQAIHAKIKQARASILKAAVEGRLVEMETDSKCAPLQDGSLTGKRIPSHWQVKKIQALFDQRLGKMLDKTKNTGELTPYLRNANVRWQSFDLTDLKLMRVSAKEIQDASIIHGDIVVCEGGEPGRCAVWKSHQAAVIQKALHRLRAREPLNPLFFSYQLEDTVNCGEIEQYITGSTIKHLTGTKLKQVLLVYPPVEEQNQIVAEVEHRFSVLDQVEAVVNVSLRRCGRLRQAVLKRAFRV